MNRNSYQYFQGCPNRVEDHDRSVMVEDPDLSRECQESLFSVKPDRFTKPVRFKSPGQQCKAGSQSFLPDKRDNNLA